MADMEQKTLVEVNNSVQEPHTELAQYDIKSMIYIIRNQQVMIDSDLAMLYQVETKVFNQAVKRNIARFPDNFRFQLNKDEFESLRSQVVTSKEDTKKGGRRYLPYVFTEQGIAMLSAVLRSKAVMISRKCYVMNRFLFSTNKEKVGWE